MILKYSIGPISREGTVVSVSQAEEAGIIFAFQIRTAAILIISIAICFLTAWPRLLVYLSFATGFFLLGYLPFRLRGLRQAPTIRLVCVVLDVLLITAAALNLPFGLVWIDWPIQMRLRSQSFLLLLLLLGEAALTYSPKRVLWTGAWIGFAWSMAFVVLYELPNSVRYGDIIAQETDQALLSLFLNPTYVSLPQWLTQLVVTAVLTIMLATAVHRSRMHLGAQVRAEILRSDLARYLSPDIADALSVASSAVFGKPTTRQVAVLFADIVGFTGICEQLAPERTFSLLRSFQGRSAKIVFRHRGTLDKFLGDGLMASFGALQDEEDAAARAIACAFDLQEEISRWNTKRRRRGVKELTVSVGVHYGPAVVGNIGSARRIEFTAVGDVVNVASRLENCTRELGCLIVISDACVTASAATRPARVFCREQVITIRGRVDPLKVHLACCR